MKTEERHLHIFTDEKWTNFVSDIFRSSRKPNQYFKIILPSSDYKLQYKLNNHENFEILYIGNINYRNLIENLDCFDNIFIHYLCDLKFEIIDKANSKTNIIWMCWGQDIAKMVIPDSYEKYTRRLLFQSGYKQEYWWKYTLWLRQLIFLKTPKGKALKRIDYCCPVTMEELLLVNKKFNLNIKYLPFRYGSIYQILGNLIDAKQNGNSILIANSSSYVSNHKDVLFCLKKINLTNRQIIIPLSYGNPQYGDQIESLANEMFPKQVTCLRSYLDINSYNKIIQGCSVAIFNQVRQQALGNIIVCLWLGIRVYLNSKGVMYKYLTNIGLPVHSFSDDFVISNTQLLEPLTSSDVQKAKDILFTEFSEETIGKMVQNIFEVTSKH